MATEKRLIDANAIYEAVEQRYKISSGIEHRCERDLLDLICSTETVDAVPVVRCRECRFWRDGVEGCTDHEKCCAIGFYMIEENGYCVYGERRTDNG